MRLLLGRLSGGYLFAGWTRNFTLLALAVGCVGFFFGVQMTMFNNFIVTRLGIEPHELGVVEGLREVPGFLNVLFIAIMIRWIPSRMAALSLMLMGMGIAAFVYVDSVTTLAMFSFIWSIGFHCWVPLEQAMGLGFSPDGEKGKWLGQLRSVSSFSWLLAIGACMLLYGIIDYEGMFVLAGVVTVIGGACLLAVRNEVVDADEERFVFRRRYGLYYALNFLQGCRKQMFITFAIFALVKVHGMPVETTMILVFVNQVLITLTAPLLGRLVDRLGERVMLSASYVGLIFVFAGYALIDHRPTLYVLYCIDNLIFFGSIALTTYVHRITDSTDLKPTLSMGVTMNHLAAVAAPLIGGLAWHYFGHRVIFLSGSALAAVSLIVTQWIEPRTQEPPVPQ
ncbi:MAG: MFS transporter [Gemmatimonadetes bacterium]|jgi:predicted MFS family arabinose efflux permease|nr:MFS transporter [Gemmatimonadota bacterium]MBT5059159.1 MFS transporter [Gemmatimonadota bacterium]MBT5143962.1 MFS transporter [Gemmatimonadota bacterium]MBT5960848.1 MFS transporter [Gemmatimonadota bacterium]MBT6628209.1 MFS transporter [Gemmatimonadota bacterium]